MMVEGIGGQPVISYVHCRVTVVTSCISRLRIYLRLEAGRSS